MNILLISANTETINMPTLPMGLGLVAAAAERAGHRVQLLDLMAEPAPHTAIADALDLVQPAVIGISIRNIDNQVSANPRFLLKAAKSVVHTCKQLSVAPLVLGGAGYSIFPDSALDYLGADMGIQGEGEAAFVMLLARLDAQDDVSDVPGLYLPGKGCRTPPAHHLQLDDWPFPEPTLFHVERFHKDQAYYLPFQTRRGCPLHCSYCSTSTIEGIHVRKRSIAAVIKELARWRAAGFSRVFFVDNTFNQPTEYAEELCAKMVEARLGISWRAIVYPGHIKDALIENMAKAGCTEVSLGFESGSPQVLSGLKKHFKVADIRHTARLLGDAGIGRMGFLLLGGPEETQDTVKESLEFADSLNLEAMKLTLGIRIYPFTHLASIARAEGVVDAADNLLYPRFYIRRGLEDWLRANLSQWIARRPNWSM